MSDEIGIGAGVLGGPEVKTVFVSPDWHGKGVGTALMRELEQSAVRRGRRILNVSYPLSAAGFYKALGYSETARKFFGDEETVLMTKVI